MFEPKTDGCSDMKDSQKFKEFLQDKYEKKKWYALFFCFYIEWSVKKKKKIPFTFVEFESVIARRILTSSRHFSKYKNRRDVEGPWSPGVQAGPPSHGPLGGQTSHNLPPNARPARPLVRAAHIVCV